ncbi:LAFE_0G09956g1_1 [Lachancea fermentati]|uniref:Ribonuclease T2-like n=1 Tax=Lachancea fermentati TaxID=4955 RepID=A0A1G4MHZ1_LACFM|nr:LAFE_0G09956g1_1 [Lachancea fermentati]
MRLPFEQLSVGGLSLTNQLLRFHGNYAPSCPIDQPLSCSNDTSVEDSCCFEYPGGVFLQTQFWDYIPPRGSKSDGWDDELEKHLGPNTTFTNHGLWPDNCDGGYEQFCDGSLNIDDAFHLLSSEQFNRDGMEIKGKDLLDQMGKLWKSNTGDDESLWIHEYNKHGTCIKTLRPNCYARWDGDKDVEALEEEYKKQAVYDYFRLAMKLYHSLDTYKILEENGIVPSLTKTYSRDEISAALKSGFKGRSVFFKCDSHQALNEIWYFHLLQGSILGEEFEPIDSFRSYSNCPIDTIHFYPKGHTPSNGRRPNPGKGGTRGIIRISGYNGFIIRNGHWMSKGTPANFDLIKAPFGNYYLKSRTGYCGVDGNNALTCNKGIGNAAQFEYDTAKGYIGYAGGYEWHAKEYPQGYKQSSVFPGGTQEDTEYNMKLKFVKL